MGFAIFIIPVFHLTGKPSGAHLISGYGWSLAREELVRPLTGLVLSPAGCPDTLLAQVAPGGGAGIVANDQVVLGDMVPVAENT